MSRTSMYSPLVLGLTGCALLILAGCATATQGPLQRIHIDSDPQGATIEAKGCGVSIGAMRTPATVLVSRRATRCEITLNRDDYERATVLLSRKVSERAEAGYEMEMEVRNRDDLALSVLAAAGMAVGLLVDVATGAQYELEPSRVFVELVPESWRVESDEAEDESSDEWWREREADVDSVPAEDVSSADGGLTLTFRIGLV